MKNFTKHNFLTKNILFSISNFRGYFTLLIFIYFPVYYFTCYSINVEFIFCIFIHYSSFINHSFFFIIQLNICNINFFCTCNSCNCYFFCFFNSNIFWCFSYFCITAICINNFSVISDYC